MKSPFPGMDPYLEAHWLDVHGSLVIGARNALNDALPDDLAASSEERIAIESEAGEERLIGPDVRIFEPPADQPTVVVPGDAAAAPATAYRLLAQIEPITERFIKVIEVGTERLITVIEFVSPTNKLGAGLAAFRAKRAELLGSGVNFVEIDLVRRGNWRALLNPHRCPAKAVSPYRYTIRAASDPGAVHLQPLPLREALPSVPIPLRAGDPQVRLALQPLVERAYSDGRYGRRLDYTRPPEPPLEADDAEWAAGIAAGKFV